MGIEWITPVDVTPGTTGSWQDVDLSSHIQSGATGAILHVYVTGTDSIGWRKNGSTDARTSSLFSNSHFWFTCGVDGSRILELYAGANTVFLCVGSFSSEAVFFTNLADKAPASGTWADYDASGDTGGDTAIGLMFEVGAGVYNWGARMNGSTDDRHTDFDSHVATIIGCDGSEICELYNGTNVNYFLQGYLKDSADATFNTNGTNLSLGSTGSWIDLSALPSGATGGFIEVVTGAYSQTYGLRKNGSSEDLNYRAAGEQHAVGMIEADASRLIEGQISDLAVDFFLVGYSEAGAAVSDVFHENRIDLISKGMKPQTAAGMGGVLVG